MTSNQLKALQLQEDRRHNLEDEAIRSESNKISKYKAKTERGKAIADEIIGTVTDMIPKYSIRKSITSKGGRR